MKITHSGYKTGVATLLAGMFALALTGCAKNTAPSQTDPANKEVGDIFANLGTQRRREKRNYITCLRCKRRSNAILKTPKPTQAEVVH